MKLPVKYSETRPAIRKLVREEYVRLQKNRCIYCNEKLSDKPPEQLLALPIHRELFPPGFFRWPVHLHHDHTTDLTIGAVHNYCNAVLWQYEGK